MVLWNFHRSSTLNYYSGLVPKYLCCLFNRFLALLAKHPLLTKAGTSALLTRVGDLICQTGLMGKTLLEFQSTKRMFYKLYLFVGKAPLKIMFCSDVCGKNAVKDHVL
ncbi:hypothetical protein J1N35_030323 [Gossypium stocksii]|uniref:Uncharacterized protein n=1 Tax=Gossypium stocksii TaxID=47602 RepID=A0A9D3UZS9_9ROSI|nr:hypothetical protein J1N35_030323 [Gossypium stocksii]